MSMLAYYHHLEPTSFYLFPVVPHFPYILNKHIANLTDFGPYGTQSPGPTGEGIWDPNSWGQFLGRIRLINSLIMHYLVGNIPSFTSFFILISHSLTLTQGGTSLRRGRDKGFTDASHIAGQATRTNGCKPKMVGLFINMYTQTTIIILISLCFLLYHI